MRMVLHLLLLLMSACSVQAVSFSTATTSLSKQTSRTYDFSDVSQWTFDTNYVGTSSQVAELLPSTNIDLDSSPQGFGSASLSNVEWVSNLSPGPYLALSNGAPATSSALHSGELTSRVLSGAYSGQFWTSLNWITSLPFGKELPDQNSNELAANYPGLNSDTLFTGLIGLWHLNESSLGTAPGGKDFVDSSNTGNHLTSVGGVTLNQAGEFNSSVALNGSDGNLQPTPFTLNTNFTASYWVYITPTAVPGPTPVYESLFSPDGDNGFYVQTSDGNTFQPGYFEQDQPLHQSAAITSNVWHHIVVVVNANSGLIYVDGVSDQVSFTTTSSIVVGNIGNDPYNEAVAGKLDEIAFWNRPLSSGEVKNLYRRGANRLKFQTRNCSDANCTNGSPAFVGPNGTNTTYFSELSNTLSNAAMAGVLNSSPMMNFSNFVTRGYVNNSSPYFQYQVTFESDDASSSCNYNSSSSWCSPELKQVSIAPNATYFTSLIQAVTLNQPVTYKTIAGISAVSTCPNAVRYAISADGTQYDYWNGSAWTATDGTLNKTSLLADLNAHVNSLQDSLAATKKLYIRTFLTSDGNSACSLTSLQVSTLN